MKYRVPCWNCGGEGVIEGECTCWEDCCCCLEPESPRCSECRGKGFLVVSELTDDNCQDAIPIEDSVADSAGQTPTARSEQEGRGQDLTLQGATALTPSEGDRDV